MALHLVDYRVAMAVSQQCCNKHRAWSGEGSHCQEHDISTSNNAGLIRLWRASGANWILSLLSITVWMMGPLFLPLSSVVMVLSLLTWWTVTYVRLMSMGIYIQRLWQEQPWKENEWEFSHTSAHVRAPDFVFVHFHVRAFACTCACGTTVCVVGGHWGGAC